MHKVNIIKCTAKASMSVRASDRVTLIIYRTRSLDKTTELIHKRKHEAEFSFGFHFTAVVNLQFMAFDLRTGQEDVL